MNVLAFGTSNSRNSINQKLARYAATQIANAIDNVNVTLLDIHDLEMPIFSEEREKENGIPQFAHDFYQAIGEADAVVISFAEYNGSYTSAYKNLFDWASRIDMKVYQDKPMIMRFDTVSIKSYGRWAKRAVIKSTVSTARSAITHA